MIFTDQEIYEAVKNNLPKVSSYVNSHGGDITLLGVKDGVVYIELIGTCKGCAMSIMTTKMVVQKELRALIHPELILINVDGTPENRLPDEYYTQETIDDTDKKISENKPTMMDKIKKLITNK
jgi:Fe-S cluster biogenesis protein NfuA